MLRNLLTKLVQIIAPVAIKDDGSWTTLSVDTKGWDYLTVIVNVGATDIAFAALKLQQSDDDAATDAYTDITGLDFDGDTNIDGGTAALPTALEDGSLFAFEVDLLGKERYIDLVATAGDGAAGTFASAIGILSRGKDGPVSATQRGCAGILRA